MADLNTQIPIPNAPMLVPGTGILVKAWYDFFVALFLRTGGPTNDANVLLDTLGSVRGGMLSRFSAGWLEFEATIANTVPIMNPGGLTDVQLKTISQLLDFISGTRGTVLYRGAAGWQALAPVVNKFLMSQGPGADPIFTTPPSSLFSGALVNKAADQTLADYTVSIPVAWDAEQYDTDNWHDNAVNNTRLTVPAGVNFVVLTACVSFDLYSQTLTQLLFKKNGNVFVGGTFFLNDATSTNTGSTATVSAPIAVVAGDFFEINFQVLVDNSITIRSNVSYFSAYAVG